MTTTERKNAQVARIVCELCDRENDAQWKCLECDEALCNDCRITHSRSKVSRNHNVTTLKAEMTSGLESSKIAPLKTMQYCDRHTTELFQMYCLDCNTLLCLDCLSDSHKKHEVVKIANVIDEKRQELADIVSISKSKISSFEDGIKIVQKNIDDYFEENKNVIAAVKMQQEMLKSQVDVTAQSLIGDLEKQESNNEKRMKNIQKEYEEEKKKLETFVADCEENIESKNDASLIDIVENSKKKLSCYTSKPEHQVLNPPIFVASRIDTECLKNMFGYLDQNKSKSSPVTSGNEYLPETIKNATVVRSLKLPAMNPFMVAAVQSSQAWVGEIGFNKKLALVSVDGELKQKWDINFDLCDVAATSSGELLVTEVDGHEIKRFAAGGLFTDVTSTALFSTKGIHVTMDDEVLVCLRHDVSGESKVVRLSLSGHIKQEIQYDIQKKALFTNASLVAENINKNVCVIDHIGNATSTLVVLHEEGNPRFRYTGPSGVKMKTAWYCLGIACDLSGCILLSDCNNHQIHQIDRHGQFMQFILTSKDDISFPMGLSLDNSRRLWICNFNQGGMKVLQLK